MDLVADRRLYELKEAKDARYGQSRVRSDAALIVATLNIIYGIGALDNANIFGPDQRFIQQRTPSAGRRILGVIQLARLC